MLDLECTCYEAGPGHEPGCPQHNRRRNARISPAKTRGAGERVVVGGGPRTGKTRLAMELARSLRCPVYGTDALMNLGWSNASAQAAMGFDRPGPWVTEGVVAVRALRKWLRWREQGRPCDRLVWLTIPKAPQRPGHLAMCKGCLTVLREIEPELVRRGVAIEFEGG